MGGAWTSRFKENVEEFIGQKLVNNNWIEEWESRKRFKNFFFVRDPNRAYSPNFQRDSSGKEIGYVAEYQQLMRDKKESFLENEYVQKYLTNPIKSWEKSATPNNTGTEYLIENLSPLTTKERKKEQLDYIDHKIVNRMLKILKPYHIGGDIEKDLEEAEEKIYNIFDDIDPHYFGNYLDAITLDENLTGTIFYKLKHPTLKDINNNTKGSLAINRNRLRDKLFGNRKKNRKIAKADKTSEVEFFYDKLINTFFDEIKNIPDIILKRANISTISHEFICENISYSMYREELKSYFKENMNSYIEQYIENTNLIELISKETTKIINNFILSFGMLYIPHNKRDKINKEFNFYFLEPEYIYNTLSFDELESRYMEIMEREKIEDETFYAGENFFIHWLKSMESSSIANVHYKHGGKGIKNIEANNQLGAIISKLELLKGE